MTEKQLKLVEEFIQESNNIEGEYTEQAYQDAMQAFRYLQAQKGITKQDLFTAHRMLMATRKLENRYKGAYRDIDVYIGGSKAMKSKEISQAMDEWFKTASHVKLPEKIKEAHIRFEKIHPFVDGNGRIGRMIMLWQWLKVGLPVNVIHEGAEQIEYYKWFK